MLQFKIICDTIDELNIYTNAISYHNLLGDLYAAIRTAQKHGTEAEVLKVVGTFYPDIVRAVDHSRGAY